MFGVGRMLGHDPHRGESQRQSALLCAGQIEAKGVSVGRVDRLHQCIGHAIIRAPLRLQQFEREQDVGGGDRNAIGKMRARIEVKGHMLTGIVEFDGSGDQSIIGVGLILGTRHQTLIDAGQQLGRRRPAHGLVIQSVEIAETSNNAQPNMSALGSVWVGIGKMIEVRRQRRRAVHGDSMRDLFLAWRFGIRACRRLTD